MNQTDRDKINRLIHEHILDKCMEKGEGEHYYPSEDGTSDCEYGCGCWMGPYRSGGPKGIDPFGICPNSEPHIPDYLSDKAFMFDLMVNEKICITHGISDYGTDVAWIIYAHYKEALENPTKNQILEAIALAVLRKHGVVLSEVEGKKMGVEV